MALSSRKKKGLGLVIGGGLSILVGVALFQTSATPEWVGTVVTLIGLVANFFGLGVTLPEE